MLQKIDKGDICPCAYRNTAHMAKVRVNSDGLQSSAFNLSEWSGPSSKFFIPRGKPPVATK
jgi:hypothetical protein